MSTSARLLRRFSRDRRGVSAVEFALIVPVMALILVGVLELGTILYQRFEIDSAVSAGANYALVNAADVSAERGSDLAQRIAAVINARAGAMWADSEVDVNNGARLVVETGLPSPGGTVANADACYCPTGSAGSLTWGSQVACASDCADGGKAGKFVRISLSRNYTPIFADYGIVRDGTIAVATLVQTQ
jgi:Flp pilus assembly pilin Flp